MFIGFKHKGLERFFTYEQGRHSGKACREVASYLGPSACIELPSGDEPPGV